MTGDLLLDPLLWETLAGGDNARIERWMASEGDRVHAGQAVAQARLLHQTLDVLAPCDGLLETIIVPAGDPFAHGAVLARVIPF